MRIKQVQVNEESSCTQDWHTMSSVSFILTEEKLFFPLYV